MTMDKKKRWGNSGLKGHGVNSPAMMEARSSHEKALAKKGKVAKHHPFVGEKSHCRSCGKSDGNSLHTPKE